MYLVLFFTGILRSFYSDREVIIWIWDGIYGKI